MTPAAIGIVIAFLIVGTVGGWHSQKSYAAHGDVKVAKSRLRGGRKTRLRSGLWVLGIVMLVLLVVKDILVQH